MDLNLAIVLVIVGGWVFGRLFSTLYLPGVIGMMLWGIILGTLFKQDIPEALWQVAPFFKTLALVVILLRAGLGIRVKKVLNLKWLTFKMGFIPSSFEAICYGLLFYYVLDFPLATAAAAACVLSAISLAAVVPGMLDLVESDYGKNHSVPTVILSSSSLDNVWMITLFPLFISIAQGDTLSPIQAVFAVPWAIIAGGVPGILIGFFLIWLFKKEKRQTRNTEKLLLLLGISLALIEEGDWTHSATLLGIMTVGFILAEKNESVAKDLAGRLNKIWVFSEITLFVFVGMAVDLKIIASILPLAILLILIPLVFRAIGVRLALLGTNFSKKERLFTTIAYLPKATVQAALGAVAMDRGIAHGDEIFGYAILAILLTAPIGLIGIRTLGPKLLDVEVESELEWLEKKDV